MASTRSKSSGSHARVSGSMCEPRCHGDLSRRRNLTAGRFAALLILLSFSAAAQVIVGGPGSSGGAFVCSTASAGAPALIRAEAVADKINDILISCSGGVPGAGGLVNI